MPPAVSVSTMPLPVVGEATRSRPRAAAAAVLIASITSWTVLGRVEVHSKSCRCCRVTLQSAPATVRTPLPPFNSASGRRGCEAAHAQVRRRSCRRSRRSSARALRRVKDVDARCRRR